MRFIAERLAVLGRGSLLLGPLLLGGCFYSPSTSIASLPPNETPTVLLAQQPYPANQTMPLPRLRKRPRPPRRSERNLRWCGPNPLHKSRIRRMRGQQRTKPVLPKTPR